MKRMRIQKTADAYYVVREYAAGAFDVATEPEIYDGLDARRVAAAFRRRARRSGYTVHVRNSDADTLVLSAVEPADCGMMDTSLGNLTIYASRSCCAWCGQEHWQCDFPRRDGKTFCSSCCYASWNGHDCECDACREDHATAEPDVQCACCGAWITDDEADYFDDPEGDSEAYCACCVAAMNLN